MDSLAEQPRPLGPDGQSALRKAEGNARRQALALCRWAGLHGHSARGIAAHIGIASQTLSDWSRRRNAGRRLDRVRGRPQQLLTPLATGEVLDLLAECRGRLGIPALKACFNHLPRSTLAVLRDRYRVDHQPSMEFLRWTRPGTVWAADFTDVPVAIDGIHRHILSVRDLASGYHLLAWPVQRAIAPVTVMALRFLFAAYGPPLVLKSDNGSHFTDHRVGDILNLAQVIHLLSPPETPRYNGANEAGIGSLKTRTLAIAAAFGRADCWSSDDVESARLEANDQGRPRGRTGPTPNELWESRSPILTEDRQAFVRAVAAARALEIAKVRPASSASSNESTESTESTGSIQEPPGCRPAAPLTLTANERASVARHAIRRALVELGLLLTRRTVT